MLNNGIIEEQRSLKNFVNLLLNLMSDFLDLKLSMEEAFGERERECNLTEETWEALGGCKLTR